VNINDKNLGDQTILRCTLSTFVQAYQLGGQLKKHRHGFECSQNFSVIKTNRLRVF